MGNNDFPLSKTDLIENPKQNFSHALNNNKWNVMFISLVLATQPDKGFYFM